MKIEINRKLLWTIFFGIAGGAALGWLIEVLWDNYICSSRPAIFALVGAGLGLLIVIIYRWLFSSSAQLAVESLEVPVFGLKLKVRVSDDLGVVGWKLFVELATRVTTQSLTEKEGVIREALSSLYSVFATVRTELKSAAPAGRRFDETEETDTVQSYAFRMLNAGLREMLSRWHPRLLAWEKLGRPEQDWPLADYCRQDLESTRQIVLAYTWGLGKLIKVPKLKHLLPPEPNEQKPSLLPIKLIRDKEAEMVLLPSDAERLAAWRIFIELVSRIATQPLAEGTGLLSEALTSLNQLFDFVRAELKQFPLSSARGLCAASSQDSVTAISLRILNDSLRPFLAKWHARLINWQNQNPSKSDEQWEENAACRAELELIRVTVAKDAIRLGRIACDGNLPEGLL